MIDRSFVKDATERMFPRFAEKPVPGASPDAPKMTLKDLIRLTMDRMEHGTGKAE